MRTIQDLSNTERERILKEANKRCYHELAEELDTPVSTIRKVVRAHNSRMKRYQSSDNYMAQKEAVKSQNTIKISSERN